MLAIRQSVWMTAALATALSVVLLASCDDGGDDEDARGEGQGAAGAGPVHGNEPNGGADPGGSPCPGCSENPGGETSDLGGSFAACALFTKKTLIDEEQALELGFDVTTLRQRAERPIETTLRWLPQEQDEAGEPAEGYAPEAEVRASITVRSYVYERPDPEFCDGTTCRGDDGSGDEIETEQAPCHPALFVGADVTIETLDGAIIAESLDDPDVTGTDSIALMRMYPDGEDDDEDPPRGTVNIDLAAVEGSLRVFPNVPEPYVGVLYVNLEFAPEETRGSFSVHVTPDWDAIAGEDGTGGADIPSELSSYNPLRAEWPAD